jgi:hypothetical protein
MHVCKYVYLLLQAALAVLVGEGQGLPVPVLHSLPCEELRLLVVLLLLLS